MKKKLLVTLLLSLALTLGGAFAAVGCKGIYAPSNPDGEIHNPDTPGGGEENPDNPDNPDTPGGGDDNPDNPDNPDTPGDGEDNPDNPDTPGEPLPAVSSVTLNRNSALIYVGRTLDLTATVLPDGAEQGVSWSSDNPAVATVENGKVTALIPGSANITATAKDGSNISASCAVTVAAPSVSLNHETATLSVGGTLNLTAAILSDDMELELNWTSDDAEVATVENGKVTALKAGTAKITVAASGSNISATCTVTVKENVVAVTSITLNKSTATLVEGEELNLIPTVLPSAATEKTVSWASDKTSIATVDSNGKVTAHGTGTATITATANDGSEISASCTVTVTEKTVKVTAINLNKNAITLTEDEEETLTVTVLPADATNKTLKWESGDENVATVAGGVVTAVGEGETEITAIAVDGSNVSATCKVRVNAKVVDVKATSVTLSEESKTLTVGTDFILDATVLPENVTVDGVKWSSSNAAIASVSEGGVVSAKAVGTAKITATAKDGSGVSATCTVTVEEKVIKVTSITILQGDTYDMETGDELSLTLNVLPKNATNKEVKWSSSNAAIASVSEGGVVSAKAVGTAKITATAKDGSNAFATITISVAQKPVKVSSITLDNKSLILVEGDTLPLKATVLPENADDRGVIWSSQDTSIATVDSQGNVTAKAEGNTYVVATAKDGSDVSAQCIIHVAKKPVKVSSITLNLQTASLTEGDALQLIATVLPEDADYKDLKWTSDNTAVATVDLNGKVTAQGVGTATITASATDSVRPAKTTCVVTVNEKVIKVTEITLNKTSVTLTEGEDERLNATVLPANATESGISWSSGNPAVATVENGVITAHRAGTAIITAISKDGSEITASCTVTVNAKIIKATSVSLNESSATLIVGGNLNLTATVLPENTTDKGVIWSSDNAAVASVSEGGVVTAKAVGTAIITATAADGSNLSASCTVKVGTNEVKVTAMTLDKTSEEMTEGDTLKLTPVVTPANATNKGVNWSSSNTAVATVDESGTVTAKAEGKATISATTKDGSNITAVANVTVNKKIIKAESLTLNKKSLTLTEDEEDTLTATVLPSNVTDGAVVWAIDDPAVATVVNGKVTALKAGTAKITATAADGSGVNDYCIITVNSKIIAVTSVTLNYTQKEVLVGEYIDFTATVLPANATYRVVSWSTSNSNATINASGRMTAEKAGNVTITATAGGVLATCAVTITEPEPTPVHEVHFYSNGALVETKQVEEGNLVTAPEVTRQGYYLNGWKINSLSGATYNFSTPVTGELTLYADWEEIVQKGLTYTYAGNECAAFEWNDANPSQAKVEYKLHSASSYTRVDSQLVRSASTAGVARADVVGLKGGADYDFKITDSEGTEIPVSNLHINSYDRSGYAHFNNTSGVGAYNNDGTLKNSAIVVYVTEATKNTVTAKIGSKTYTGLVNILQNAGTSTPLVMRVLGTVGAATWKEGNVEYTKTSSNTDSSNNLLPEAIKGKNGTALAKRNWTQAELISGGYNVLDTSVYAELNGLSSQIKWDSSKNEFDSCWNDCSIKDVKNVTFEGIGEDARIFQWGLTWKNCNSIEVRNLTFEDYTEDACSFEGSKTSASSISDFTAKNFWVHHNVFEQGVNYWDVCKEQDKHDGDGSTDLKGLAFVTFSYNEYHDCHKTGLVGGSNSQTTASVTFHHNYYNRCSSRLPLARQANMHMYNNYYYQSTGDNMSLRAGAYALIENCYFDLNSNKTAIELQYTAEKTSNGVTTPETYGAVKIINSVMSGKISNKRSDTGNYYAGTNRTQSVDNTNKFGKNFDTNSSLFYYENGATKVEVAMLSASDVPTLVPQLAGVMKRTGTVSDGGGSGNGGGNQDNPGGGNQDNPGGGNQDNPGGGNQDNPGGGQDTPTGDTIIYTFKDGNFEGNGKEIVIVSTNTSEKPLQYKATAPAAEIEGISFSKGKALKIDSAPVITINLQEERTVTLYLTVGNIKLDDQVVECKQENGYYTYTVTLSGTHTFKRGSAENALYMIKIV